MNTIEEWMQTTLFGNRARLWPGRSNTLDVNPHFPSEQVFYACLRWAREQGITAPVARVRWRNFVTTCVEYQLGKTKNAYAEFCIGDTWISAVPSDIAPYQPTSCYTLGNAPLFQRYGNIHIGVFDYAPGSADLNFMRLVRAISCFGIARNNNVGIESRVHATIGQANVPTMPPCAPTMLVGDASQSKRRGIIRVYGPVGEFAAVELQGI